MKTFVRLDSRYELTWSLELESGLHVGSGDEGMTGDGLRTDAMVARREGKPFIPGSSLKGALRSMVERIMQVVEPGRCCMLFADPGDLAAVPQCARVGARYKEWESDSNKYEEALRAADAEAELCPVCQLFGSTLMAARLKVGDATLNEDAAYVAVRRDGVGIDRDTETAKEKIKYDFEVVEGKGKKLGLTFTMQLENADDWDWALLHIIARGLNGGMEFGGKKTRGMGKVRGALTEVRYFDGTAGYGLVEYLCAGNLQNMTPVTAETKMKERFEHVTGH